MARSAMNSYAEMFDEAAERAVVAAALLNQETFDVATSEGLKAEDFGTAAMRTIWTALLALAGRNEALDIVLLKAELERAGQLEAVGGVANLSSVMGECPAANMAGQYARRVVDLARAREFRGALVDGQHKLDSGAKLEDVRGDVGEAIDRTMPQIDAESGTLREFLRRDVGLRKVNSQSWHYDALDKHTGGIPEASLTVLGAYPSTGKTSLATNVLIRLARAGVPVAMFSLEMSGAQVMQTLIARESGIPLGKLRAVGADRLTGNDHQRVMEVIGGLGELPFHMDTARSSSVEVAAKARLLRRKMGVRVVVVDYLQLLDRNGDEKDRRLEIDAHVKTLKNLAKSTGLCVVLLSQLAKPSAMHKGQQDNPPPSVQSLKESGGINEAADLIGLLWRPNFRKYESCPECGGNGGRNCETCRGDGRVSTDKALHVIVAKNRFGEAGYAVKLGWNGRLMQVTNATEEEG